MISRNKKSGHNSTFLRLLFHKFRMPLIFAIARKGKGNKIWSVSAAQHRNSNWYKRTETTRNLMRCSPPYPAWPPLRTLCPRVLLRRTTSCRSIHSPLQWRFPLWPLSSEEDPQWRGWRWPRRTGKKRRILQHSEIFPGYSSKWEM